MSTKGMSNVKRLFRRLSGDERKINPGAPTEESPAPTQLPIWGAYFSNRFELFFLAASQTLEKRPAQTLAATPLTKRLSARIEGRNCWLTGIRILVPRAVDALRWLPKIVLMSDLVNFLCQQGLLQGHHRRPFRYDGSIFTLEISMWWKKKWKIAQQTHVEVKLTT
jgi:hypothetical protein